MASFTLLVFLINYGVLFYSRFILLFSLFYTDHLVSIILFNHDYLNSTTILLCLCFYSLYYNFVNFNSIYNNNVHMPFISLYIQNWIFPTIFYLKILYRNKLVVCMLMNFIFASFLHLFYKALAIYWHLLL